MLLSETCLVKMSILTTELALGIFCWALITWMGVTTTPKTLLVVRGLVS